MKTFNSFFKSIKFRLYIVPICTTLAFLIILALTLESVNSFKEMTLKNSYNRKFEKRITTFISDITENQVNIFNLLSEASIRKIDEEQLYERSIVLIDNIHNNEEELESIIKEIKDKKYYKNTGVLKSTYISYSEKTNSAVTMSTVDIKLASIHSQNSNLEFKNTLKVLSKLTEKIKQDNEKSQNKILSLVNDNLDKYVIISLFCIVTVLIITISISRWLQASIDKIYHFSKDIKHSHDYKKRLDINTNDEIGTIAASLNEMIEEIDDRDKRLEFSLATNKNIIQSLSEMLIVTDTKGDLIQANSKALAAMGIKSDDNFKNSNISSFINYINTDDGYFSIENFNDIQNITYQSSIKDAKSQLTSIEGTSIPVLISITQYMNTNGDYLGAIFSIVNEQDSILLKEIKETQDKMIETSKLASLGTITAGIAHEIKNPLNIILNSAKILKTLINEDLPQTNDDLIKLSKAGKKSEDFIESINDSKELTSFILTNTERVNSIVESMLLQARNDDSTLKDVDINSMLDEQINLAYHSMRAKYPYTVTPQINSKLSENYGVYPNELSRAILNILDNSFYAMKEKINDNKGEYTPKLDISLYEDKEKLFIEIKDNGVGIKESFIQKIEEPFFTTKPPGEGTGLGMALVRKIVFELHKGELEIDSKPNQYCKMTISIPKQLRSMSC